MKSNRDREREKGEQTLEGLQAQQGQKLQIYSSLQSEASQGIFFIFKRSDYFIAMFKTDRHNSFGGGREEEEEKETYHKLLFGKSSLSNSIFLFLKILLIFFKKKILVWNRIVLQNTVPFK